MLKIELRNPSVIAAGTRLPIIDELKGWAMLLVLIYHSGGILGWENWLHGEVGVDIFLIASGFTLTMSSSQNSDGQFLLRRLLRIYPAYWVALGLFVWGGARFLNLHPNATSLWLHVFGLHGFWEGRYFSEINDSFWFISLILLAYVIFLGLRKRLDDFALLIGFGALLTTTACLLYINSNHTGGLIQLAVRLPSFFLGLLAGQFIARGGGFFRFTWLLAAGLIAMTFLGWRFGIITFYALASTAMLAGFLCFARPVRRILPGRLLLRCFAFVGLYSYEIFLLHQPLIRDYNYFIYRNVFHIEPSRLQVGLGIIVALLVTVIAAWLLHHACAWLFHLLDRRKTTAPALAGLGLAR